VAILVAEVQVLVSKVMIVIHMIATVMNIGEVGVRGQLLNEQHLQQDKFKQKHVLFGHVLKMDDISIREGYAFSF
jgi:hypothetical protein